MGLCERFGAALENGGTMIRLRSALAVSLVCMLVFAMLPATATAGKTAVPVKTASGTVRAASTYEVDQYDAAGMGDSVPANARTVTIGDYDLPTIENHTIDHVDPATADIDWIKFTVSADDVNIDKTSYLFRTQGTTYNMDTVIEVYGPSATSTFLTTVANQSGNGDPLAAASNDDDTFGAPMRAYDSSLVFRPTAPGTYWVRIRPWSNSGDQFDCVANPYKLTMKRGITDRVWGLDRIQTAIAVSKQMYQAAPGGTASLNKAVVVASAYNYPDALGGAVLCGIGDGPLLLTSQAFLAPGVADEIRRLGVNRVYVVGGEAAVGSTAFDALQDIDPGISVIRVKGDDRIWTAAEIALQADSDAAGYSETMPTTAIIAYAYNYPDALAASAFAAARNIPILLTGSATLADDTDEVMYHLGTTDVIIMGGTGVISPAIQAALETRFGASHVMRIAGDDRYETAKEFASWACDLKGPGARNNNTVGLSAAPEALPRLNHTSFGIASGQTFADALPGGVACGQAAPSLGSPILLTRKDSPYGYITAEHDGALPPGDTDWVSDVHTIVGAPFKTAMVFGGNAAVSHETAAILDNSLMLIDAP